MPIVSRLCLLAWALLHGGAAFAADFQPVPGHAYNATVDPKRQVSGHMVVGMSFGRGEYGPQLQAYLPGQPGKGTVLRIDIDSPDGRFLGTGLFVSDAPRAGWNTIELLPNAAQTVPPPGDLPRSELSVAATLVAGDPQRQNRMVPVRWADAPRGDGESPLLRLYVNSRRAEKVSVSAGPGSAAVDCRRVTARSVRRYDTICELELPRPAAGGERRAVTVTRVPAPSPQACSGRGCRAMPARWSCARATRSAPAPASSAATAASCSPRRTWWPSAVSRCWCRTAAAPAPGGRSAMPTRPTTWRW